MKGKTITIPTTPVPTTPANTPKGGPPIIKKSGPPASRWLALAL